MLFNHHLVPRHRGGSDDPSNLVRVTHTQHIMFHWCEWKRLGLKEDLVAYQLMSKQTADAHKLRLELSNTPENRESKRNKQLGVPKHGGSRTEEHKKLISDGVKKWQKERMESGLPYGRTKGAKDKKPRKPYTYKDNSPEAIAKRTEARRKGGRKSRRGKKGVD